MAWLISCITPCESRSCQSQQEAEKFRSSTGDPANSTLSGARKSLVFLIRCTMRHRGSLRFRLGCRRYDMT